MQNKYEHIISPHFKPCLSVQSSIFCTPTCPRNVAAFLLHIGTSVPIHRLGSNPPTEMPQQHGVGSLVWLNLAWILPKSPSIWGMSGILDVMLEYHRYPLVNVYITNWKITMLSMGKSTISMGHFQ